MRAEHENRLCIVCTEWYCNYTGSLCNVYLPFFLSFLLIQTNSKRHKDKVKNKKRENIKLRTKNKQLKKEIDEYENYNKRISEIFEQKTIKNAKTRFKLLYNQIKFLPDEIAKFIRNLARDIDKTLKYIENKNIPKTNNWLELFFKIIFPKKYRNRFKTKKKE